MEIGEPSIEMEATAADGLVKKDKHVHFVTEQNPENKDIKAERKNMKKGRTELERKIIQQVEFLFSDSNIYRDKFLRTIISNDAEGWVSLSTLKTVKQLSDLSEDTEVILNAISKSDQRLVEISDDRQKIRRNPMRSTTESNEQKNKEKVSGTVYVKGFPLDTVMRDLLEFFESFEKVIRIEMLDAKKEDDVCSVLVTFDKKEQALEFIAKESIVYKGFQLARESKEKYMEKEKELLKANIAGMEKYK